MSKFKKLIKKTKGFTLIELMMVIAVIGILAAVLIPKIGTVKNDAKGAGVEANMNTVQAMSEAMITKYKNKAADTFETDLMAKISTELTNPVNEVAGTEKVDVTIATGKATTAGAVSKAIFYDDDDEGTALEEDDWTLDATGKTNVKGAVFVGATGTTSTTTGVYITGFDADGNQIRTEIVKP